MTHVATKGYLQGRGCEKVILFQPYSESVQPWCVYVMCVCVVCVLGFKASRGTVVAIAVVFAVIR